MIEFLIILVVVSYALASQYLHYKHISTLEQLVKARDLADVKYFESKPAPVLPPDDPEDLVEVVSSLNTPQEIRNAFKK